MLFTISLYAGRKVKDEHFDNIPVHNALQQLILNPSHKKLVKPIYTKSAMKKDKKQFKNYIKKQNKSLKRYFNNPNDNNSSNDYEQSNNEHPSTTDDFIWGIDEESDSDEEQTLDNNAVEIVTYNKGKTREYTRNMLLHLKRTRGKHYIEGNQ